jgi:hypothetical protein
MDERRQDSGLGKNKWGAGDGGRGRMWGPAIKKGRDIQARHKKTAGFAALP